MNGKSLTNEIFPHITRIISETNGLSLENTLDLLLASKDLDESIKKSILEFYNLLNQFKIDQSEMEPLLAHPVGQSFYQFFQNFPLKFREEHIHLTGSLSADFVYPKLKQLLSGPDGHIYKEKITAIYGESALPIESVENVDRLMRLKEGELFARYLEILILPKLILKSSQDHAEASYHLASTLYQQHNVGAIRLKFTLSRATTNEKESIPGGKPLESQEVVLGLYEGFKKFKEENPDFEFILSPCFRKEPDFYDAEKYKSKKEHFEAQVSDLLELIKQHPELKQHIVEVDTVGSELHLYRKEHFQEMKIGFRKLQSHGLKIRSHHGETWHTLLKGIQSVDNAMNIWHVDAVEHGLSLGMNPNFYFHQIYQSVLHKNQQGLPLKENTLEYQEIMAFDWGERTDVRDKLINGTPLSEKEGVKFVKIKFHTAKEIERYQHDVLNRMIDKDLSVIALPSSNKKLTGQFEDYKDHPFSWWEKKGVKLGVGTDNYITLNTDYIREMLILLFTDPAHLKITKLLMVCTGEKQRALLSRHLWNMRKSYVR